MKCEDYLSIIEEYADGELDEQRSRSVLAHLAECRACASYYQELQREQEAYLRYERDIEVTPALWSGIQSRIEAEKASLARRAPEAEGLFARVRDWFAAGLSAPRFSPALAALIVMVAVGATVAVMSYLHSRDADNNNHIAANGSNDPQPAAAPDAAQTQPAAPASEKPGEKDQSLQNQIARDNGEIRGAGRNERSGADRVAAPPERTRKLAAARRAPAEQTPEQLIRDAEAKYLAAIDILSRDVNRRRNQLSPEALAKFETTIAQIDSAIAETRRAVRQNPQDPIALNYLLAAYSKKVEVLREMARD